MTSRWLPLLVGAWLGSGCAEPCENTWYADLDGDGFGDPNAPVTACLAPFATVADASDCDDDDSTVRPGALDPCNGIDEDCDGELDEDADNETVFLDADGDGAGNPQSSWTGCDGQPPPLYTAAAGNDCDDLDPEVRPGRVERCNERDDDCDGLVDEDAVDQALFYIDADEDGFGEGDGELRCPAAQGDLASQGGDCDDSEADVHPDAVELCNRRDDDCDGLTDNDPIDAPLKYVDYDFDGWGGTSVRICESSERDTYYYGGYYNGYYYYPYGGQYTDYGYYYSPYSTTDLPGDCDDFQPTVNPAADEVCNNVDDDCDGAVDDNDSNVADQQLWYFDQDQDDYGDFDVYVVACDAPGPNWSLEGGDCEPGNSQVRPDAIEFCNGIDDDCDGLVDDDDPELNFCP